MYRELIIAFLLKYNVFYFITISYIKANSINGSNLSYIISLININYVLILLAWQLIKYLNDINI